jgi:hypothetical protein
LPRYAVSQVSKAAQVEEREIPLSADMEACETAGLETCAEIEQHALTSAATVQGVKARPGVLEECSSEIARGDSSSFL